MNSENNYHSLEEVKLLCDNLPDPALLIDANGKITIVNKATIEVLDISKKDLQGEDLQIFKTILTEESFKKVQETFNTHIQGETVPPFTVKVKLQGEKTAYYELHGKRIEQDGKVKGIIVIGRNITEKVNTTQKLREYKRRLEGAMQAGNIAWWEMDIDTGKVVFNDRKATMLGYAPEKFSHYTDFTDLLHPKDYDKAMQAMREHLEGKDPQYKIDYRIGTKDGNYKWFHDVGGITQRNEDGDPLKATGLVIDISERMEIERKHTVLHHWAQLLNRAKSIEEIFNYTANALEKTLGYTHIGLFLKKETFLQLAVQRGYGTIPKEMEELSLEGQGIVVKAVNEQKTILIDDASNFPNFLFVTPNIRSELAVPIQADKEVIGLINIESDKPYNFDESDKRLVETLASHVAVAINGLREKKKRVSHKQFEQLRNQFLVMASHEIKTPLTPVKTQLEMLAREHFGTLNAEQKKTIEKIMEDIDRATKMMEKIRRLSDLQSKRIELTKTTCQISSLVEKVLPQYTDLLQEKNITLNTDIPDHIKVSCDKEKILQTLQFLIENAIDYTEDTIWIRAGQGQGTAWISIQDNGPGIPKEDQEKIFEPFYRVESDRHRENRHFYTGGLSLAIGKQIIEAHKGTIQVESTSAKGTTFKIVLPKEQPSKKAKTQKKT